MKVIFEFSRQGYNLIHRRGYDATIDRQRDYFTFQANFPGGGTIDRDVPPPLQPIEHVHGIFEMPTYTREDYERIMDAEIEKPVQRNYNG